MLRSLRETSPIERAGDVFEAHEWLAMYPSGSAGVSSDRRAMGLPAFWRGLQLRAGVLSTLPLRAEVDDRKLDVVPPIMAQPDPAEDRQMTIARLELSLVLRGEYVALLAAFDGDGFPHVLKVVDPRDALRHADGSWTVAGRAYSRDEVLWFAPFVPPGEDRGISVIELFRRMLDGEIAAHDFQRNFYLDGAQPPTIITVNKPGIAPSELEKFKAVWMSKMRGRREPIVVPGDTTASSMPLSNRDAQFLESRQFAVTDIANMIGLPPYFLGATGSSMTYSNVQDERRNLLDFYLRADLYAIERGFTRLVPEPVKAKFDAASFLRLDAKGTAETLKIESQWLMIDEIRAVQGREPLPNGMGQVLASLVLPGAPVQPSTTDTTTPNGGDTDG